METLTYYNYWGVAFIIGFFSCGSSRSGKPVTNRGQCNYQAKRLLKSVRLVVYNMITLGRQACPAH
jgi:hypothetical protein